MYLPDKRIIFPSAFLVILGIICLIFFSRSPVLIVVDDSFSMMYGPSRLLKRQVSVSLKLFRPVRLVTVSEGSSFDVISISVKNAVKNPYTVFFPYRYEQAAAHFYDDNPGIPVAVLCGRHRLNPQRPELTVIRSNVTSDYYVAGAAATILSEGNTGHLLFFHDGLIINAEREYVMSGIKDTESYMDKTDTTEFVNPRRSIFFINVSSNYSQWENVVCAIINGAANDYFEKTHNVPSIIFSWIDPQYTPNRVKIIIDDSPLTVVVRALEEIKTGKTEILLNSEFSVISGRINDKKTVEKLEKLFKNPEIYKKTTPESTDQPIMQ